MTRGQVHGLGAMVFVLAWLAYGIVLGGDYVFDDVHSVAANPALHDLGNLGRLLVDPTAFSATGQSMYRPALLVSFALNVLLSPAAWSLKAGNVLLHALTAWLLWRWLRSWRVHVPAAFITASVFAVHPLLSECVNLVSARSELLLAGGALLTLLAHRAWQRGRRPALAMAGMVFGTLVACGSKETGVVLPVLLAVQVFAARRPGESIDRRRALAGVLPVVLLVLGYLVLRQVLLGQATVDLLARSAGDPTTGHGRTLLVQLATMGTLLPQAAAAMTPSPSPPAPAPAARPRRAPTPVPRRSSAARCRAAAAARAPSPAAPTPTADRRRAGTPRRAPRTRRTTSAAPPVRPATA